MQWYRQDCCWQVPGSWRSDGMLPSSSSSQTITQAMLDDLPGIPTYASCLFVVHAPAAAAAAAAAASPSAAGAAGVAGSGQLMQPRLLAGELVVSLERLKRVQLQVRALGTMARLSLQLISPPLCEAYWARLLSAWYTVWQWDSGLSV